LESWNPEPAVHQALRKELDAVAAGGDLEALAAGDGGLSAGTFGANHDAANEVVLGCAGLCVCRFMAILIHIGCCCHAELPTFCC
jgi:hypothetical protein